MPQMNTGDMQREQRPYGRYEGNQSYNQPHDDGIPGESPLPNDRIYDDDFIDAFAQRLSQRMSQGPRGKVYSTQPKEKASAGQRLALAIVSIVMLTGMAGASLGIAHNQLWLGLIALGILCFTVIAVNGFFNQ
jgi:hypothetical protein